MRETWSVIGVVDARGQNGADLNDDVVSIVFVFVVGLRCVFRAAVIVLAGGR